MREWLKGKKTYIAVAILVVLASYESLTGDLTVSQAVQEGRVVEAIQALALGFIRAGISKATT